jgi:hypothetical protein
VATQTRRLVPIITHTHSGVSQEGLEGHGRSRARAAHHHCCGERRCGSASFGADGRAGYAAAPPPPPPLARTRARLTHRPVSPAVGACETFAQGTRTIVVRVDGQVAWLLAVLAQPPTPVSRTQRCRRVVNTKGGRTFERRRGGHVTYRLAAGLVRDGGQLVVCEGPKRAHARIRLRVGLL